MTFIYQHLQGTKLKAIEYEGKGESNVKALNTAFTSPPVSDRYFYSRMVTNPTYASWLTLVLLFL